MTCLKMLCVFFGTNFVWIKSSDSIFSKESLKTHFLLLCRTVRQRRSASKPAFSINHLSGKGVSSSTSHDSSCSLRSATVLRHPVLDESLIREQTKVDHFWG